ncbi:hypothetical protein P3S67_012256 [Capsicum chacoense]
MYHVFGSLYNNVKEGTETPNFEAREVEVNDLQAAVVQYLQFRGTSKNVQDERQAISGESCKTYWTFNSIVLQAFRKLIQKMNVAFVMLHIFQLITPHEKYQEILLCLEYTKH